ncbi:MAG TPA: S9 family peptidase [Candidatus Krumholzibacteria bacterium]|nr:S9 family peptidase [Candidatus Krumholzibacteria bacterium]HPD70584.1 S9 family peptidase [Candidatus Krumholzibacteria bacterium]HRY39716.1 S9 family peptidase [Candidatus Krumholzibacteria bacterium]
MSRRLFLIPVLILVACFASGPALAADAPAETVVPVNQALRLGPVSLPLPAFHDAARFGTTLDQLLESRSLDVATLRPAAGLTVALGRGEAVRWRRSDAPLVCDGSAGSAREEWFACYLRCDRWQKATLTIDAPEPVLLQAWLDGGPATLKEVFADGGAKTRQAELKLEIGTRLLVIRSVAPADQATAWTLAPGLKLAAGSPASALAVTCESRRPADIRLVLDTPRVQTATISPDGALAAIQLAEFPPGGKRQTWLEIRRTKDGSLVDTWRGSDAGSVQWAPAGQRLSFTLGEDKTSDLWLRDLETGEATRLLRGIADLQGYRWAPDGSFLVYEVRVEAKPDERKIKRVTTLADRQPGWRDRSYLVMASVPAGISRRLTAGPLSPGSWSISPDSRRILFFLGDEDLAGGRPYATSELWELDLETCRAEKVLADRWIGNAAYGPDPHRLLLQGSPSAFDGLGREVPAGVQVNDYGGQVYLWDRRQGRATPLGGDLRPDVDSCWWSLDDGLVYALCTDTQFANVWRCDPARGVWEPVETGLESTSQFDLARRGRAAVARGTGATTPNQIFAVDLERGMARQLLAPGADAWRDVAFGEVEFWQAPLPDGELLDGRIYWPLDYDESRTYPLIVYYYGGTTPETVDFGGRYPKNVWAGQGYIVYVPQPSGAIGYGQEFAARHVNDWGERTAWEVIEATKAFLAAHPGAEPGRVGCIGASYGGFLTEYVITQTDLFAAAVSHAGISSIASYWGEGLWGYVYGARALANAFPWSDRDVYVEHSALFHADKITTPLLLLHGDDDTNVPVGESDQLFTALKLLGRDVEYVQIQGQNHHILDHDQRIVWNDTILAFFARWLKDQPQWWESLYPED